MELKEGNLSDLFDEQSKAAYQKIKLDDNPVILKARLKNLRYGTYTRSDWCLFG